MPVFDGNDQLMQIPIADDDMVEAAAIDLTAAGGQQEDRRVHQQLLIAVGLA